MKGPSQQRAYGPRRVSDSRQIALPKELMDEMGMEPGDGLFLLAWRGRLMLVEEAEVIGRLDDLFQILAASPRKRR